MPAHVVGLLVAVLLILGGGYYLYHFGVFATLPAAFSFRFPTSTFDFSLRNSTSTISSYYRSSPAPTSPRNLGGQSVSPSPVAPAHTISDYDIPKGFTRSQLSPHFHVIRLGSVSPGYSGSYGQISLSMYSQNAAEKIDITGWQFKSNRGGNFIPQAVALFDPSGNTPATDIVMSNGDYANFYTSASANGKNFRLNKCMGYLAQTTTFNPQIPFNCPYPSRSDVAGFSGACQDYALSLSGCRLPDSNPPISNYDYACRNYLDTLNYKGCFDKYRFDKDFMSNEWRVWLGTSQILDDRHDQLLLLDNKGLVVDVYSY